MMKLHVNFDRFGSHFGPIWGAKLGPKSGSRGAFICLGLHLGTEASKKPVSKSSLKGLKGEKLQKPMGFLHISDESALRALGSFWVPLGAFWGPFSGPKRALKRTPEASEKRSENDAQKKDPNWPPETPQRQPSWLPNRPQIGPGPSFFSRSS